MRGDPQLFNKFKDIKSSCSVPVLESGAVDLKFIFFKKTTSPTIFLIVLLLVSVNLYLYCNFSILNPSFTISSVTFKQ